MFGNGFYNPYMYQPYYQAANMARNFGNLASAGASSVSRGLAGASAGNSLAGAAGAGARAGGIGSLLSKFSFSGFLNGASKTLNVVNQAIPIFYQVRPMINNAKTMFRIMGAVKDDGDSKKNTSLEKANYKTNTTVTSNSNRTTDPSLKRQITSEDEIATENPVFFI